MQLTEQGYDNLIELMKNHFGLTVTKDFIDQHYSELEKYFPDADDPDYLDDLKPGEEIRWTFEAEANDGGIFDTLPRERIASALAEILTDFPYWPINGDSEEYKKKFSYTFYENAKARGLIQYD